MQAIAIALMIRSCVAVRESNKTLPPGPMRGALKAALSAGLTEVQRDPSSAEGWKLFLLAPRMLLYRGRGETRVPRAELDKRVALLAAGQCRDLLDAAAEAAAGSDVRCVLADDEASADLLLRAAERLANADVPADVLAGVRLGRMVGLRKPDGGVRGLVMSGVPPAGGPHAGPAVCWNFPSRLRHFSMPCGPERGLSPSPARRAATELDARTTVLSIDGVGAYDHISRASMLSGLQHTPSLTALLPFVAQFYAEQSAYVFYDAEGAAHEIAQGEGGEQGDP